MGRPNPLMGDESRHVQPYLDRGYELAARRLHQVEVKLTIEQVAELGDELVEQSTAVVEAVQALAAMRSKYAGKRKRLEGEIEMLSGRLTARTTELRATMTTETRADYARQIACLGGDLELLNEDAKRVLGYMRDDLVNLREERESIRLRIRSGVGLVSVPVADLVDHDAGEVVTVRLDTGAEIGRRQMLDEERQADMFVGRGKGEPAGRIQ